MKKYLYLIMGVYLLFLVPSAIGLPFVPGDTITINASTSQGYGGGPFEIYFEGVYLFDTFCMQRDEFISDDQSYVVGDISKEARYANNPPGTADPLDQKTAWIYRQYLAGSLNPVYTGGIVQRAIWHIEGEGIWTSDTDVLNLIFLAGSNSTPWDLNDVAVLNLGANYGNQDQLAPVPEPATMLLLGTGLIGLAGVGRRKFFKK